MSGDSGADLPDYSGAFRPDLRFTDFSVDALATRLIPWSEAYLQPCVDGWSAEVTRRYGAGIMTFNRCVAVDQWEARGRPDILEKNCHSTCPKSMIVTTKLYNPKIKVDILAIPPRKAEDD